MNKKLSIIFFGLGFLFLLNAIFGRYIVLPGYLAGLESGGGTLEGASQVASTWKIIRYLLWGYSFKFGIYFIILGAMFRTTMPSACKWGIGIGGFGYIGFAYLPLPDPTSIIFGIAGGIMTLLMIYIFCAGQTNATYSQTVRKQPVTIAWSGTFSLEWRPTPYARYLVSKPLPYPRIR